MIYAVYNRPKTVNPILNRLTMEPKTKRLVAITGIGMVTPLGISVTECWENLIQGKSGIGPITQFDSSDCLTRIGGQIPDNYFRQEQEVFSKDVLGKTILPTRLSLYSVEQAIADSGLSLDDPGMHDVAVISGSGGSSYGDDVLTIATPEILEEPFFFEMLDSHAAAVSRKYGFSGPCYNVATACSSGAFAVGLGYDHVIQNQAVSVVIGVDTMLLKDTVQGFNQLMALSELNQFPEKASRPFDKKRTGFVMSDGACALILEPIDMAIKRNARIYAVISGYAATSEAYNIIAPEPEGMGMAETMIQAMDNANLDMNAIGYINAHGTSTQHNDVAETRAIRHVFKDRAHHIPASSQKSMIGHTIGAAGTIETAITALTLYHQIITPTINQEAPDPACDLDYVPNHARHVSGLTAAISNSFGFGGHNCCIVLEKHESR